MYYCEAVVGILFVVGFHLMTVWFSHS